jgi:hypothetical protein
MTGLRLMKGLQPHHPFYPLLTGLFMINGCYLTTRSAFLSPRLWGTCLRSVLYPAMVNSRCTAVSMCSWAPVVAPACCVQQCYFLFLQEQLKGIILQDDPRIRL